MNTVRIILVLTSLVVMTIAVARPNAAQDDTTTIIHGVTIHDPFRWMEDSGSEDVKKWIADQSARTEEFVAGAEFELAKKRIFELANYDLQYAPKARDDKLFFLKRPKGAAPVELWLKDQQSEKLLLSSKNVPDTDYARSFIGGRNFGAAIWPNPTGSIVAYGYTDGTSRGMRLRFVDARSGLNLTDMLRDVGYGLFSMAWDVAGNGFFYSRAKEVEVPGADGTRVQAMGIYYHKLGTDQSADIRIVSPADSERTVYTPYISGNGKFLIIASRVGLQQTEQYLVFQTDNLEMPPLRLFEKLNSRFQYLGNQGDRLFFQTDHEAPNGRIISVDLPNPEVLSEVVKETEFPMLVGSSVGGDIFGYADQHILIGFLKQGIPEVRVYDIRGTLKYVLDTPKGYTIWGGVQGHPRGRRMAMSLLSALSPSTISTFDISTGTIVQEFDTPIPVVPSDYVIARVTYESTDSTPVPMSVVRHRSTKLDGDNPAIVYGYGMHRWVSFLFYQPHIMHWLEMGGVYAMPAIRGGGEFGPDWHQSGIKNNRHNALEDFYSAGRWLINNGYTNPGKLAANGSSASGPLSGMVALDGRGVFAASTVDYPVADMVRAPLFGNGALMTEEYGSLDNPIEARSIIEHSPYHQGQAKSCKLATLVMVGENDRVVLPFHGLKLTAVLQANQSCDQKVLFRQMPETGHNYGNTPDLIASNAAVQLVFLKRVLNF